MGAEENKVEALCLRLRAWGVPGLTVLGGGSQQMVEGWMDPLCLSKGEEIHPGGICPCSLLCWGLAVTCLEGGVRGTQSCLCGSQAGLPSDHPLAVPLQPWCSLPSSPCCKLNTEHFSSTRELHPDHLWVNLWERKTKVLLSSYWKQKPQTPKDKRLYLFRWSNARFYIFFTFSRRKSLSISTLFWPSRKFSVEA